MGAPAPDAGGDASVALVVPTLNSGRTLEACLRSLARQTYPTTVVVVDNFSSDATPAIARQLADRFIQAGPERSAQRNRGAREVAADIVGFIDSDMIVDPDVTAEVVELVAGGAGGAIIPERTVGSGYWADVRRFERSFYDGLDAVEALRFVAREIFDKVGGFDEQLDAGEDWDLTLRVRELVEVGRTRAGIDHDEGRVHYLDDCRKKASYAVGVRGFVDKHGFAALGRAADRPYLRRPWQLAYPHPLLGAGVVALKGGEATAAGLALARAWARPRLAAPTPRAGPPRA